MECHPPGFTRSSVHYKCIHPSHGIGGSSQPHQHTNRGRRPKPSPPLLIEADAATTNRRLFSDAPARIHALVKSVWHKVRWTEPACDRISASRQEEGTEEAREQRAREGGKERGGIDSMKPATYEDREQPDGTSRFELVRGEIEPLIDLSLFPEAGTQQIVV